MFKNPFSFHGRIRRTEFGISYVMFIVGFLGLVSVVNLIGITGYSIAVHVTALYWFLFSQSAKRCHDLGHSGFYQLIPFYVFALLFNEGANRRNKYGQDPKLMELQRAELSLSSTSKGIISSNTELKSVGSELLSGVLLTTLTIAIFSYFYSPGTWLYFIAQIILVMGGYYLVLLFGTTKYREPKSAKYFLLHRAIFSVSCYLCILVYEVYSNNISYLDFSTVGNDISQILAIFILTYIPYLIFNSKKSPIPISIEA